MPEGPLFDEYVLRQLEREGVTADEAADDFVGGVDLEDLSGTRLRVGRRAVYAHRMVYVFGRNETIVTRVWFRNELDTGRED